MAQKLIPPPVYFLISIITMVALHRLIPIKNVFSLPYSYIGLLPLLIGISGDIWAPALFKKATTTVIPFQRSSALVTTGPYRYSRNPMYLGLAFILIGIAILHGSISPVLVIPVFIWLISKNFIEKEETMLEETFGDAYLEYKKQVRRWI